MNRIAIRILRKARRAMHKEDSASEHQSSLRLHFQGQAASDLIRKKLLASEPCMITRFGSNELNAVLRHWYRRNNNPALNAWRYVAGRQGPFWWDDEIKRLMGVTAGFFPCSDDALSRFADCYLHELGQIDVLGTWLRDEAEIATQFSQAQIVKLTDLEPYYHADPWSTALEDQTVLVIHPFAKSIQAQYEKRLLLFSNPKMLPTFRLKTLKAVQSSADVHNGFPTWFDALAWMCEQVRNVEFDIALIGAGAYGLPLAAFVKSIGKKGLHLGGATQILFGIKGRRWDNWPFFQNLYNEHWIRPLPEETPGNYKAVESGCYW